MSDNLVDFCCMCDLPVNQVCEHNEPFVNTWQIAWNILFFSFVHTQYIYNKSADKIYLSIFPVFPGQWQNFSVLLSL